MRSGVGKRGSVLGCAFFAAAAFAAAVAGCRPGTGANAQRRARSPVAQTQPAESRQKPPMYAYRTSRLENGLRVITLEDFSCPIVSVQLWYHVGSKDDRPDRQGFAHMFEHMMFRGTDRLGPTDHFDLIRQVGGTANGYTAFDATVYLQTLPANQLRLALWLEAERMGMLRIDEESFRTERRVVEEERRVLLNSPYGTLVEKVQAELFKVHPYRWPILGRIAHLRAASVPELRAYWKRYYLPNNATLVIVGGVKHDQARRLAQDCLGWIPRGQSPPRPSVPEPTQAKKRSVVIREQNAPAPLVGVAFRTVPAGHPDAVAVELLRSILAGGTSSRLYRDLVANRQLAVRTFGMNLFGEQDGVFAVAAVLPPFGGKSEEALSALETHMAKLRARPVRPHELLKARNQMRKGLVTQMLHVSSKAGMLGQAAVVEGDVSRVNRQLESIRRVTSEDLLRVAQTHLAEERATAFRVPRNILGGLFGKKLEPQAEAERPPVATTSTGPAPPVREGLSRPKGFPAEPPLAGLPKAAVRFEHSRHTLPNGLKVIVVPNREVPFVTVRLGLLAGAWSESKPAVASLAMQMLRRGTARQSERELAEELDTYAISLWGSAGMDTANVAANCLTEHFERAVARLADVVLTPTFPDQEFQKLRKQVRADLAVLSAEPFHLADRELKRRLYGEHPYARSPRGEIADVDAVKVEDLKDWWGRFVRPDMAVLIFAGDVRAERALELAGKAFGEWKARGPAPRVDLPRFPKPGPTRIYLVDRPGSVQSQIRIGQLGLTRRHPGWFVSRIVSGYFGQSFGSRLNESVRVKKGLTYGIWGGYTPGRFGGSFAVRTFSKSASTGRAVRAILDEVRRLATEAPGPVELTRTQSYYLGSFARQRETPHQAAGALWMIASEGLPHDYFETMLDQIARAKPDDCLRLVRRTLDPGKMVIVVVGEAEKVRKDLEKIAPVDVVKPPEGA